MWGTTDVVPTQSLIIHVIYPSTYLLYRYAHITCIQKCKTFVDDNDDTIYNTGGVCVCVCVVSVR